MDSCEAFVFNINKNGHHDDMFLVKHNIQWWDTWLVNSQMFLFVITSISVSRITRALCKSTTVYDASFTMIFVIPKIKLTVWSIYMIFDDNYFRQICVFVNPNLTQSKIKLEFRCICIGDNSFAPVSTIFPLYIAAVLLNKLMFSEN